MTIHKEGRLLLSIAFLILFGLNYLVYRLVPENDLLQNILIGASIILYLLILQFFRNPNVTVPKNDKHIIAPADGKVVTIEVTEETEYFNEKKQQISIFMSPLNVHVNRTPIGGKVTFYKYHQGKYLVAWHPKSSTENERTTVVMTTSSGQHVLFRQIAGAVARRIKCYVKEGDQLDQGDEFGFIKFGSRVDIFLPLSAKINVKVDQKTKGGETVLAQWD